MGEGGPRQRWMRCQSHASAIITATAVGSDEKALLFLTPKALPAAKLQAEYKISDGMYLGVTNENQPNYFSR